MQRISAAGVAVCVASQGKVEKTKLSLGLTGLRHLFPGAALFSAYSVPRSKPHPDLFLHAAAMMEAKPGSLRSRGGHSLRGHRGSSGEDARPGLRRQQRRGGAAAGRRGGAALVGGAAGAGIELTR
jgi:hypothetical protein